MLRGAVYGLILGLLASAVCEPTVLALFIYPWTAFLAWPALLLVAAPLLVGASVPLGILQWTARRWLPSQIAGAVAIALGIPFGFAVCWVVRGFLGMQGNPWNEQGFVAWIPAAFGAGIGLGLGGLQETAEIL